MYLWIFKASLLIAFVSIIISLKNATKRAQKKHKCSFDEFNAHKTEMKVLLWIRGILGLPAYVFIIEWILPKTHFTWAYLAFPVMVNWIGLVLLFFSLYFFWWAFRSIKTEYHGTVGFHEAHSLITTGAYRYIRHPINVSFIPVMVSIFLLTSNWVLGILLISVSTIVCLVRSPFEERQLIKKFGKEYENYMKTTGKYLPKIL